MALFSVAGSSLVGLNENTSCFSSCMDARGGMLSTEEFFPGRGIRIALRISDCKSHEGWDGVPVLARKSLVLVWFLLLEWEHADAVIHGHMALGSETMTNALWCQTQGYKDCPCRHEVKMFSSKISCSWQSDDLEPCRWSDAWVQLLEKVFIVCTKLAHWLLILGKQKTFQLCLMCRSMLLYQLLFQTSFIQLLSWNLGLPSSICLLSTCLLRGHFSLLCHALLPRKL